MKQRLLGGKLPVSAVAMGCMRLDGAKETPDRVIGTALELGMNFFDHADIYGGGRCEARFGDGSALEMKLLYRVEREALGTAGAVRACADFYGDRDFLVISGDCVCDFDLKALMDAETWILPSDAVAWGFATDIDDEDDDEDDDEPKQSAFGVIMQKLTAPASGVLKVAEPDYDAIADKIAVKLATKKPKPEEEPKEPKTPPVCNYGWDKYFQKKEK